MTDCADKKIIITNTPEVYIVVETNFEGNFYGYDVVFVEKKDNNFHFMLDFGAALGIEVEGGLWAWISNNETIEVALERRAQDQRRIFALVFFNRSTKEIMTSNALLEEKIYVGCNKYQEFILRIPVDTIIELSEGIIDEVQNWNEKTYYKKQAEFIRGRINAQNT